MSQVMEATDSVTQHRLAMVAERAIENSFPAKVNRVIHGPALSVYQNTPGELAAELNTHMGERAKLCTQCHEVLGKVREGVQLASGDLHDNLDCVLDVLKVKKLPLVKSVVQWYVGAKDLAERHVEALRPVPEKLNSDAEQVVASIKTELEKMGSGLASMIGYSPEDPTTAARQFEFVARNNLRARVVIAKAEDAKTEYEAAVNVVKQIDTRLNDARKLLQTIAVESVVSAV